MGACLKRNREIELSIMNQSIMEIRDINRSTVPPTLPNLFNYLDAEQLSY